MWGVRLKSLAPMAVARAITVPSEGHVPDHHIACETFLVALLPFVGVDLALGELATMGARP